MYAFTNSTFRIRFILPFSFDNSISISLHYFNDILCLSGVSFMWKRELSIRSVYIDTHRNIHKNTYQRRKKIEWTISRFMLNTYTYLWEHLMKSNFSPTSDIRTCTHPKLQAVAEEKMPTSSMLIPNFGVLIARQHFSSLLQSKCNGF